MVKHNFRGWCRCQLDKAVCVLILNWDIELMWVKVREEIQVSTVLEDTCGYPFRDFWSLGQMSIWCLHSSLKALLCFKADRDDAGGCLLLLEEELNQFFLVTQPTCPPSFIRIRPQVFEISCYILVEPDLSMVKNHFKNSNLQIRIRVFTKIESICRGHTPNLSTKFRPNPSPTFWDIVLYIGWARSLNGEESVKQFQ